jgi:hypothetical protein
MIARACSRMAVGESNGLPAYSLSSSTLGLMSQGPAGTAWRKPSPLVSSTTFLPASVRTISA